ncbi:putative ankyrin repeat protein [Cotonvirus japonicus]|uniref:Ankyrin repeat protein n=1 Tax=Cotonvirus japonicus TaxID=2811091 RepID=A0ABM7NTZ6_9VIRU|nr:putative ankyrin repeat protein [Cotonvirus japonicus]BCS83652.1 putative ankyrin repeat protein [Cotonvirus japonicus]
MTNKSDYEKIMFFKITDTLDIIVDDEINNDILKEFTFTTSKHIHKYFDQGLSVSQVYLQMNDPDFEIFYNPINNIWKATKITLGPKLPINKLDTIKFLIDNGVELDILFKFAMENKHFEIANWLINSMTDVSRKNLLLQSCDKNLILELATKYHNIDSIPYFKDLIVSNGYNLKIGLLEFKQVKIRNMKLACWHGNIDFLKYFSSFLDPIVDGYYYNLSITSACCYNHVNIVEYLTGIYPEYYKLSYGVGFYENPFIIATKNNNVNIMKILVDGIPNDLEKRKILNDYNGFALSFSCKRGHFEMAKYLVEIGVIITINNNYCLKRAARKGSITIVKLLVENNISNVKVDIHASHDYALRWSARNNHLEVFEYLIQNKANISAKNNYVIRYAIEYNRKNLLKILFKYMKISIDCVH